MFFKRVNNMSKLNSMLEMRRSRDFNFDRQLSIAVGFKIAFVQVFFRTEVLYHGHRGHTNKLLAACSSCGQIYVSSIYKKLSFLLLLLLLCNTLIGVILTKIIPLVLKICTNIGIKLTLFCQYHSQTEGVPLAPLKVQLIIFLTKEVILTNTSLQLDGG